MTSPPIPAKWPSIAWAAWIAAVLALFFRPFLKNLQIFRDVGSGLYTLMLSALAVSVAAAIGYHYLRQLGFRRWEPIALPIALIVLCAIYSPAGVAVALWMLAAAFATGRFATRKLGVEADPALSTLAGFGIFALLLFVLGVTHAFYLWIFVLLLAIPPLLFWKTFRELTAELRSMYSQWTRHPEFAQPHVSIAVFAAIVFALLTSATLLTPAWNGDTIQFHLPLMRVFLASHSLTVPKSISYGHFPQGFEVLGTVAYRLAGQIAAQFVNPAIFCLAILILYRIARACGISRSWAVAGVVLGVAIPFVHWSGSMTKNDLLLATYQLAALLCIFRWRETRLFRWILLSGFFMAMSFGIKHVAIFGAIPWAMACAIVVWRQPNKLAKAASLAAVFLAFGLIWQARAYVATGDPFAPANSRETMQGRGNRVEHRGLKQLAYTPYDMHFRGRANFQSPTENPMGIVLLLLAPLWFIRRAGETSWRSEGLLWLFVILYYPFWGLEASVLRYALAPVLLLAILGAARLALFPKWLAATAMAAALLSSLPITILIEMAPAQIPLFAKQIDAATFLRRTLPPYGAVEFLSQHAAASDSIASIGDWAAAYAPNPATFHVTYLNDRKYPLKLVLGSVQPADRYIILPRRPNLRDLESALGENRAVTRVYQDHDFVVDELTNPRPPEPRP